MAKKPPKKTTGLVREARQALNLPTSGNLSARQIKQVNEKASELRQGKKITTTQTERNIPPVQPKRNIPPVQVEQTPPINQSNLLQEKREELRSFINQNSGQWSNATLAFQSGISLIDANPNINIQSEVVPLVVQQFGNSNLQRSLPAIKEPAPKDQDEMDRLIDTMIQGLFKANIIPGFNAPLPLTDADTTRFLEQAQREIGPYFDTLLNQAKKQYGFRTEQEQTQLRNFEEASGIKLQREQEETALQLLRAREETGVIGARAKEEETLGIRRAEEAGQVRLSREEEDKLRSLASNARNFEEAQMETRESFRRRGLTFSGRRLEEEQRLRGEEQRKTEDIEREALRSKQDVERQLAQRREDLERTTGITREDLARRLRTGEEDIQRGLRLGTEDIERGLRLGREETAWQLSELEFEEQAALQRQNLEKVTEIERRKRELEGAEQLRRITI